MLKIQKIEWEEENKGSQKVEFYKIKFIITYLNKTKVNQPSAITEWEEENPEYYHTEST